MAHTQKMRQYALQSVTRYATKKSAQKYRLPPKFRLPRGKWKIMRGDIVRIIEGRDAGKQGRVLACILDRSRVVVEGCNLRTRQVRGENNMTGRIIQTEQGVHFSNVQLVDPKTGEPTKVKWMHRELTNGDYEKVRVSEVSGEVIEYPQESLPKFKVPAPHPFRDTMPEAARERTWVGPWEFYTEEQKEQIINEAEENGIEADEVPDLIFKKDERAKEWIRMLGNSNPNHGGVREFHCQFEKPKELISKFKIPKRIWDDPYVEII